MAFVSTSSSRLFVSLSVSLYLFLLPGSRPLDLGTSALLRYIALVGLSEAISEMVYASPGSAVSKKAEFAVKQLDFV